MSNKLYTGITTDINRRWNEHRSLTKGAKYFRMDKPKELVFVTQVDNRSEASKLESKIKKLAKSEKLKLVESDDNQINQ